ncbi:MAG: NotI family restriction endonuclease [Gimesia sp.]
MAKQPLAEVFGFPIDNHSGQAIRQRTKKLCPYNNKVPNCTKDKANAPLGVCSILESEGTAITCPVRFREDWLIAEHAATFFFSPETAWTSLTEVRLNDSDGKSAGNIDIVLVAYDDHGKITDFGSLEIQAVYISGNVRRPFEAYMKDAEHNSNFDWSGEKNYPRPDYLSSSRKRLIPQLLFKGGILHAWKKKSAVALTEGFFETLPKLEEVPEEDAEMAWMLYDLVRDEKTNTFKLTLQKTVYTQFEASIAKISQPNPGEIKDFIGVLQDKLDSQLDNPPDAPTLQDIMNQ